MEPISQDGWRRDEQGRIFDDKGFEWYGHEVAASPEFAPQGAEISGAHDGGKQRIVRIFSLGKNPGVHAGHQEIYNHYKRWFEETLFASGLTTDDNYPPRFQEEDKILNIVLICKPTVASRYIYETIGKQGGYEARVKGVGPVKAYKSDSLEKSLREGINKKQNGGRK